MRTPRLISKRLVELLSRLEHLSDIEPSCARKILMGAVAYAATCGINPAKDFAKIKPILSAADDGLCSDTFTFGRDGKPVYVQGPERTRRNTFGKSS